MKHQIIEKTGSLSLLFRLKALSSTVFTQICLLLLESLIKGFIKMSENKTVKCPICGSPTNFTHSMQGINLHVRVSGRATKNIRKQITVERKVIRE
jgi:hypothetical protein